jgi:hypothetical protein
MDGQVLQIKAFCPPIKTALGFVFSGARIRVRYNCRRMSGRAYSGAFNLTIP